MAEAKTKKPWPSKPEEPETIRFAELVELFRAPAMFKDRPTACCMACSIFFALKVIDRTTKQDHYCDTAERCAERAREKMKMRKATAA